MTEEKQYIVRIYTGIPEDSIFEYGSIMNGYPKAIYWLKSPGYATIEEWKE